MGIEIFASESTPANNITVVLSYLFKNFRLLYFSWKSFFCIISIPSAASLNPVSKEKLMHGPRIMCRLLEIGDPLANSPHSVVLPKSSHNGVGKSFCYFMRSFYIKMPKCYNLDTYQAKKSKQTKVDLTVYRPDYRKYLSPEILYIPYKWFAPQTPLKKNIKKSPRNSKQKVIQWHALWLNLKKVFQIMFSRYADRRRNPLVQIHAPDSKHRYPCTLGVSQNSSPLWSNFTAD